MPIGCGQTISQPSLVALMTATLQLKRQSRVLEVGTGSGYQTAILAELAGEVFSIERLACLAAAAKTLLRKLGYQQIQFRVGDGAGGWPEAAPFDAIIVTAAPSSLPAALVAQLARGGRMVAPIGSVTDERQRLVLVEKNLDGVVRQEDLGPVRFVPLISELAPRPE